MAKRWLSLAAGLGLAAVCAVPYLLLRDQLRAMPGLGYSSLALVCAISNAVVLLPSSATVLVLLAARTLNPLLCALFGALGAAVGEQTAYLCGLTGRAAVSEGVLDRVRWRWLQRLRRSGFLSVFLFAALPLPTDLAGIAAGADRMRWPLYVAAVTLGKLLKYMLCVLGVFYALPVLIQLLPNPPAVFRRLLEYVEP